MPIRAPRPVCALLIFLFLTAFSSAQQVRHGIYRGTPVTYVLQYGKAIFQGDIVLEKVAAFNPQQAPPPSYGIDYAQYLWPKVGSQYQVPYVIQSGSGDLTNLSAAISQFNATFANIQFVAYTTQTDFVNFYFNPNDFSGECEATVGRIGGEQQVGGSGSCALGTILHEMGHTIGLWHEQSRPDRNAYVSVNYGNLIKGSISNFNQIYDNAQTFGTLFDYASIMEYPAFSFSRNGGAAIESIPPGIPLSNFAGYSATDIDGIERLYGSAQTDITVTSNPPGLQVIVDGATVTTPQVFTNWALFSTHTLNIPTGVQSQAGDIVNSNTPTTFYYTYGRWNDSTAANHTITVLPGNGEPSTPATSPSITTYSANFIQLVSYAASVYPTGTGSVTPTPAPQSYPGSSLLFYTARQEATLTATPVAGQNFYEFNNAYFWLPGGLGANPKTFYVPDTGLNVNTTAEFSPNPVYTVTNAPDAFSSYLYIYGDGGFAYAPKNYSQFYDSTWTPGSTHTVGVDQLVYPLSSNTRFSFNNWSDGTTTTTDTIVLPSTSATYTATLTPEYYVTDYVNESCAGTISVNPSSPYGDGFYPSGDVLTFTETPNTGWIFTEWQYDLSGNSASQPLTVTDEVLVTADYNVIATPFSLTSLSPAAAVPGSPSFTLILNGTGFTANSVVSVNGTFPVVKFISSTQLSVPVTAAQIAKAGAFQVWVDSFPSGASCAAFAALPFTVADSPIVTPSPLSLSFTAQSIGTVSPAKVVKLTNSSASAVTINSITTTPYFSMSGKACGPTLAAGASCTVNVIFQPVVTGPIAGSLIISDSAPDSPQTVAITATAELPLTFTPATLAFGTETVGHTTAAKIASVTNNTSATETLSFSASGNYAISSTGTTCGATLAAKAKCNIAVTFTPTANGSINGAVTLTDTSGTAQLIALSGTGSGGTTPPLTFNPTTLTFAAQSTGTSSTPKLLTIKNVSTAVVTLTTISTTGYFSATGTGAKPCAANVKIAASGTCTLNVTFSPALEATGTINGAVVVTDNALPNQQIADTKGTIVLPLTFSPAALTFAPQTVATASPSQTVTITNNLSATIDPIITGNGEFAAAPGGSNPCTSALASKASCTFVVTFTPSAVGTRIGVVGVSDTANPSVQTLIATGIGQ